MIDKNELASGYKDVLVVHRPVYCAVFASVLQDKPVRSMESDEFQESFIAFFSVLTVAFRVSSCAGSSVGSGDGDIVGSGVAFGSREWSSMTIV